LERIFRILGNPTDDRWPGWRDLKYAKSYGLNKRFTSNKLREKFPSMPMSDDDPMYLSEIGLDLLQQMFNYDPCKRITAA